MSNSKPDETLPLMLAAICGLGLSHCAVLLCSRRGRELSLFAQSGVARLSVPGSTEGGIAARAAESRQVIYAAKVVEDNRYVETVPGTRSQLAIPLLAQDGLLGVLDCRSGSEGFFDSEITGLLTALATQIALTVRQAQLQELERQHAAQLEAINLIARQTTAVTNLAELLHQFCALLLNTFAVDHVSVLLVDENRLVLRAHHGRLTLRIAEGSDMPASVGLCGRALAQHMPVLCNDVAAEPDYTPSIREARSELCLPLISFGQSLGVLSLASARQGAFDEADLKPLEAVADICTSAIQNAIYFERVRQLAYRDGLTGIFNRRFFEMRILEELERSSRYASALSVLLIDLDGYKGLNDEFGHLLGDEVLRQISALFLQQLRKADVVCRYGGDEFAVLLPQTSGEQAAAAAEKLRRAVAAWEFPGVPRPITLSVGVACCPANGRTRDELVKAADDALYGAKQQGRNRVVSAPAIKARGAGVGL